MSFFSSHKAEIVTHSCVKYNSRYHNHEMIVFTGFSKCVGCININTCLVQKTKSKLVKITCTIKVRFA